MWAITRRGHVGAPCERVERCLYVYLLRRGRRVVGETGDEAKGWEESIAWWFDDPMCAFLIFVGRNDTVGIVCNVRF
jgi:hypothetical protein